MTQKHQLNHIWVGHIGMNIVQRARVDNIDKIKAGLCRTYEHLLKKFHQMYGKLPQNTLPYLCNNKICTPLKGHEQVIYHMIHQGFNCSSTNHPRIKSTRVRMDANGRCKSNTPINQNLLDVTYGVMSEKTCR